MAGRLPDPFVVASTKLSQEWSANRVLPHMNEEWLDTVLSDDRFAREMDNGVKCRLLLAGLLALNSPTYQDIGIARAELQESLQRLQQAAKPKDADEWFRITAAAAGPLDGRLHLDAVTRHSAVVQETITTLKDQVQNSTNQHLYPPLESKYISSSSANFSLKPDAGHFTLRPQPRVQPLTTGVSYAAATPPPPALGAAAAAAGLQSSATQADHTAGSPAWIRQKLQKADIMRTASLATAEVSAAHTTEAAAAAAEPGSAGPLSRTKVAQAKTPRLQMLGDEEQQEMNKLIKEQSARKKDKGHGLALRHTETAEHLIPTSTTTRVKHEEYNAPAAAAGYKSAGIRLKMNPRGPAAAAAAAAAKGGTDQSDKLGSPAAENEDDYYENVRDNEDDDFIVRGEVNYRMREARQQGAEEAMYGVTGAVERDIDELFEDSGSENGGDDDERRRAVTGVSRSGRMRHHHEADRDEQTPEELLDDLDVHEGEVTPSGTGEGPFKAVTDAVVDADGTHAHMAPASTRLTAKRRRVVVESDEDDD